MSKKRQTVSATPQGLVKAERALKRLHGTQSHLADALKGLVGRSTIQIFFQGNKIQVDKFQEICKALTLESQWEAIAGLTDLPSSVDVSNNSSPEQDKEEQDSSLNINAIVEEVREKVKLHIKERCSKMRVLDMAQPIKLTGKQGIYTSVNILDQITGRQRLAIAELIEKCNREEELDRFSLSHVIKERVPGLQAVEQHSKLMVLGKPGAGKTTFLKYLAMQCIEGLFQNNQVPWFITLKDFAELSEEPNLLEYIAQQLLKDQLPNPENEEAYKQWWQENGQAWTKQLRSVMIEHRNIGHDWQFSDSQKDLLNQYYNANKLLVDCLNTDCYVSREVRQEIEDTLLLPVKR